jgi:peroxiredoxin
MTFFSAALRRIVLTLLFALCLTGTTRAADDLGPPIGSAAPDIGMPLDQTGAPRRLVDLMGSKGLVLMFFRSAEWCPYCQAQLIDINSGVADIEKRGYRIAALSYDKPETLAAFTARRSIGFTFLSDPKSEVIDRYNLRDPSYPQGSRAYGVPRPIIFILNRDGIIKGKLYEEGFKQRPPVSAVIAKIDEIG